MGAKESEKKRKRSAQDTDSSRPSKSRIIEAHEQENISPNSISTITKKSGLSRQEKSERRSKKAKRPGERKNRQHDEDAATEQQTVQPTSADTTSGALVDSANHMALDRAARSLKSPEKPKDRKSFAEKEARDSAPASTKANRFIVFVGNLPYTATNEQISSHFAKLAAGIKSIRLGTDKQTGQGKGFAFLEFDGFEKMKTCLKLYHHSIFDPENKLEDKEAREGEKETGKGRRINVELTAGGGGKSKVRRQKIGAKNKKLDEERERTKLKEREQVPKEGKRTMTGANGVSREEEQSDTRGAIHPSRLSRVAK